MDVKKVSRNPLIYIVLIGALLFAGFLLTGLAIVLIGFRLTQRH